MIKKYASAKEKRKARSRYKLKGNAEKPRFSVFRSNKQIYIQAVDDEKRVTVAAVNSRKIKMKGNRSEIAYKVGEDFGKLLLEKNVKTGVFDRGIYRYHGRVKKLAEGIRSAGVKL